MYPKGRVGQSVWNTGIDTWDRIRVCSLSFWTIGNHFGANKKCRPRDPILGSLGRSRNHSATGAELNCFNYVKSHLHGWEKKNKKRVDQ